MDTRGKPATLLIVHDSYKFVEQTKADFERVKDVVVLHDDGEEEEEEDGGERPVHMADFVLFILSSKTEPVRVVSRRSRLLLLANSLSKECIYVFLEQKAFESARETLDLFKCKFAASFKIHFYEDKFDNQLVDDVKHFVIQKTLALHEESTSSDSELDSPDEKPFRIGAYKTRCTHGLRCYCTLPRTQFWR